jgi:hypothetical protein
MFDRLGCGLCRDKQTPPAKTKLSKKEKKKKKSWCSASTPPRIHHPELPSKIKAIPLFFSLYIYANP